MKAEKIEHIERSWKQLHVDVALLKMQIETLKSTIGQQDYSSLKFTEKAQAACNKLSGILNELFAADTKHSKSLLGIMKKALQLQNELSSSINTIRNYGESLRSESINLLQVQTRVGTLLSYLNETKNIIPKASILNKLSNFAKTASGVEKRRQADIENLEIQSESPKRTRRK